MNLFDHIRNASLQDLEDLLKASPELINQPDERGFTPLVLATYLGHKEVTELLLNNGADVNAQDPTMGMTA